MVQIPHALSVILRETSELAHAYLVGGCVRDALFKLPQKDFDIEVFHCTYEQLEKALQRWGRTDFVGKSFGVIKLKTSENAVYDFCLPRRDSKVNKGHKGFQVAFEPMISLKDAASRRDFTINALMFDPRKNDLLDFFGGLKDLENRVLRHTSQAFAEDPLRVLRGMQFAARYQLEPAPETVVAAASIKETQTELPVERIWAEWSKWSAQSVSPSRGLKFLRDTEWIGFYPEISNIIGVPQDPEWHPEGDVFTHTGFCCDALAKLPEWIEADLETRSVLMLATLLHDTGKSETTQQVRRGEETRIISPGHEMRGVDMSEKFLARIGCPLALRERILPLVANHMAHLVDPTDRAMRRLAKRLEPENIANLCTLITADSMGRPPKPAVTPPIVFALRSGLERLQLHEGAPKPILLGRHLLEKSFEPGKQMGELLEKAYEAQLEGEFFNLTEALRWLEENADQGPKP